MTLSIVASERKPALIAGDERPSWRDGDGAVCARIFRTGEVRWIDWPGLGLFAVADDHDTVRVWPSDGVSARAVAGFFARRLQPLIFQTRGYQALHASGVLAPAGAVAICGPSGSGKSTLAYALHLDGLPQIADDALVFDPQCRPPRACMLPFRPQLRGQARDLLISESPVGVPDRRPDTPLAVVILLQRDPDAPTSPLIDRVAGPRACVSLLAHAHTFDSAEKPAQLVRDYASVADAVPVLSIRYRPVLTDLPVLVGAVRSAVVGLPSEQPAPRAAAWR